MAKEAHSVGLAIAVKNAPEFAAELADVYDWVIAEDCFKWKWCGMMTPFILRGKPVVTIEYPENGRKPLSHCEEARRLGIQICCEASQARRLVPPLPVIDASLAFDVRKFDFDISFVFAKTAKVIGTKAHNRHDQCADDERCALKPPPLFAMLSPVIQSVSGGHLAHLIP